MFEPVKLKIQMSIYIMNPRCEGIYGDLQCQVFGSKEIFATAYLIKFK